MLEPGDELGPRETVRDQCVFNHIEPRTQERFRVSVVRKQQKGVLVDALTQKADEGRSSLR